MKKNSNTTVKNLREELNLTQAKLAQLLGVGANYVYLMESGIKPVSKKMQKRMDEIRANPVSATAKSKSDVREELTPYIEKKCNECTSKDIEIKRLHEQIADYRRSLDTAQNNLSQALELLQSKNEKPAPPASGASSGYPTKSGNNGKGNKAS